MEYKFIFEVGAGEYKVPINQDMYRKNFEYYSEMGIYPEEVCREKSILISGYRIIKQHDFDDSYRL